MRIRRKTYFVDKDVQGALALRVVAYWIACLWGVFCVLAGFPIIVTWWFGFPNAPTSAALVYQTWLDFWPAIAASLFLMPLLVRDVVCLSNRFVGPFFRLRSALQELAQGKTITPISFRKGDFWFEIVEDVNRISAMLAAQNNQASAANQISEETPSEMVGEELVGQPKSAEVTQSQEEQRQPAYTAEEGQEEQEELVEV